MPPRGAQPEGSSRNGYTNSSTQRIDTSGQVSRQDTTPNADGHTTANAARDSGRLAALFEKASVGDSTAFEELVREKEAFLYGLAMGQLQDRHMARDAVQETLLKCWTKINTLRNPRSGLFWLGTILINTCQSIRRKKKREPSGPSTDDQPLETPDGADAQKKQERMNLLARTIQVLEEEKQMILALRYTQELSYRDIARNLGITEDQVRGRLYKAREELRKKVGRRR